MLRVRVFRGRNLWRQRKNALILDRQYLEQSPLSGIGKRRPLVLPEIITDDLVRTSGATGEVGVDDLGAAELHRADLISAHHVWFVRPFMAVNRKELHLFTERTQDVNRHRI